MSVYAPETEEDLNLDKIMALQAVAQQNMRRETRQLSLAYVGGLVQRIYGDRDDQPVPSIEEIITMSRKVEQFILETMPSPERNVGR